MFKTFNNLVMIFTSFYDRLSSFISWMRTKIDFSSFFIDDCLIVLKANKLIKGFWKTWSLMNEIFQIISFQRHRNANGGIKKKASILCNNFACESSRNLSLGYIWDLLFAFDSSHTTFELIGKKQETAVERKWWSRLNFRVNFKVLHHYYTSESELKISRYV